MEYYDLKKLSSIIEDDESYLRKLFSVAPLSKDMVAHITTNYLTYENLHILLYLPKFYKYIDQNLVDSNYNKFINAINLHLEGYRPIDFEDNDFELLDTHFYDSIIQNSFTLAGIEFIFNDDRDDSNVGSKTISAQSETSKNITDDLPF